MGQRTQLILLLLFIPYFLMERTAGDDYNGLLSLMNDMKNTPPNWVGSDPCGNKWDGIVCTNSRVTTLQLLSMNLSGTLSGEIQLLSELQTLDLSYNSYLTGQLPPSIGSLKKLVNLNLIGCGFFGSIPDTIGNLQQLTTLSLTNNSFSGPIPASIGNLSKLYWLDLAVNQLDGPIPVSPGLDTLLQAKHFHLDNNKLSGEIPPQLFSSNMILLHLILNGNNLNGSIPDTLGNVQTLEVIRFDRNLLSGTLPSNLNNLVKVNELYLSNNKFIGPIPNLTGMSLTYVDLSNNSFAVSDIPPWVSTLQSLTTLVMENTQLQGTVPNSIFNLPNLQTLTLRNNKLNGTLNISTSYSNKLQLIDLQNNSIAEYVDTAGGYSKNLILVDNPVCNKLDATKSYCAVSQSNTPPYLTPPNSCVPAQCTSKQISSPNCKCAYPYSGTLVFRAPSFSDLENSSYYIALQSSLMQCFQNFSLPVDSVSLNNPIKDSTKNLELSLELFSSGQDRFNRTGISIIGSLLSGQTFKPPQGFGPYYFLADPYGYYAGISTESKKSLSIGVIIGAVAGGTILLLLLVLAGVYALRQKRRAERASEKLNPFAHWDPNNGSGGIPQLKGARSFSFEELKKYTNKFSEANSIGSGGYGKVYQGILPTGQLIAIKRAQTESMQGGVEFKTEIELLSRVHHKNLVSLVGFCFDQGEQMLVYEYVPNGTLKDGLSGKSGIRLDWIRRLKVALGAARGLAYLHELANPPIIHRDIKSTNILLDERLNAKVADFGLSKLMGDAEIGHVTTQVKGTMGYLDPEYYMTQQLTEKSDVYGFGVVMLELITARMPIERGKYIVRVVQTAMDKTKVLYNLHEILDPAIGLQTSLKGLEKFVDLAMRCVEESGANRPAMGMVVKEIENIMEQAGLNPNAESATTSESYDVNKENSHHPYSNEGFEYSGAYPTLKIEPH
ncbi:leucine-rich repeat receptor protein kinase HPCA1-like isoform X1 [Corylus avellana]|uniref:leucine-rich repeat receptor protein kinase HPCA1-like isoform X1 n=1 Tax=Corylus avellana TaxID=13451 RepID=UPI00286B2C24|nr:leucine-rich repeat receptor protein kinase HPCA1-like isoform X1 [Corylus avellana]